MLLSLEKAIAPHSSTLAWKIPWTEEPGRGPWGREESDTTEVTQQHATFHSSFTNLYSHQQCTWSFLGGSVVKNPLANTGDRLDPWSGKIPHATKQLSPCTTTIEPVLHGKGSHCNEEPAHPNWRVDPAHPTQRKAHAAAKTQHGQEINK